MLAYLKAVAISAVLVAAAAGMILLNARAKR